MKTPPSVTISNFEVLPIVEGGRGISLTNGYTSGAFTKAGAVGTVSGVFTALLDENGQIIPKAFKSKKVADRQQELIEQSIAAGIQQAQIAHEISGGKGPVHLNLLWEQGGTLPLMKGILEGAKGLIHGITCGAGMPFKLGEIAAEHKVHYYPIVSSARALKALWQRGYKNTAEYLGGIVYEDPWKAGGHNGLSNSENPQIPQDPYPRVVEIRQTLDALSLSHVPIIMGGGVWNLSEWENWFNNPEIGKIAFQFGTRPLLTTESPVSALWHKLLTRLTPKDIILQRFSPTGFYSSAWKNPFLEKLFAQKETEMPYTDEPDAATQSTEPLSLSAVQKVIVTLADKVRASNFISKGLSVLLKTPDKTLIFVTPERMEWIRNLRASCVGCLSQCLFSGWSQSDKNHTTGRVPDPRLFCIYTALVEAAEGKKPLEDILVFLGHSAYRFATDPFYKNGFIPTTKQLVDALMAGK